MSIKSFLKSTGKEISRMCSIFFRSDKTIDSFMDEVFPKPNYAKKTAEATEKMNKQLEEMAKTIKEIERRI